MNELSESCENTLTLAWRKWKESSIRHRDGYLEIGRLLHNFLLDYLCQGDGISPHKREELGISRRGGVAIIMDRLKITTRQVNLLIGTAMAVQLLSNDGNCGEIGWGVCRVFCRFIVRKVNVLGRRSHARKDISLTLTEEWEIKKQFCNVASEMFCHAVAENMTQVEASRFVLTAGGNISKARSYQSRIENRKPVKDLQRVLRDISDIASPRDVAEIILDGVRDSDNGIAIAEHLLQLVKGLPKRYKSVV